MKYQYIYYLIIAIILVYLFYLPSYIQYLPTFPVYPDNEREAKQVITAMNSCTEEDKQFFHMTNESVIYAFAPHVKENNKQLHEMAASPDLLILGLKYLINRPRPEQINPSIKPLDTSTAQTPAFPAGHAMQAQILANKLGKKYPEKRVMFQQLSKKCDIVRVKTGLHYYSDGEFGRRVANVVT